MSLCRVVHTGDIIHQYEVFFEFPSPCRYVVMSLVLTRLTNMIKFDLTEELEIFENYWCLTGHTF